MHCWFWLLTVGPEVKGTVLVSIQVHLDRSFQSGVCVSVHSESVFINRASELCQYESSEHCDDIHSLFTISLFLCIYKEEYLGVLWRVKNVRASLWKK